MSKPQQWVKAENVAWRKLNDSEGVVLHLESGQYFSLNETATAIWELLQTPRSVEAVVAAIAEGCDGSAEVIEADVRETVQELASKGLLAESEDATLTDTPKVPLLKSGNYQSPEVIPHEAIQEVTGSHGGSHSGGGGHYWFPT